MKAMGSPIKNMGTSAELRPVGRVPKTSERLFVFSKVPLPPLIETGSRPDIDNPPRSLAVSSLYDGRLQWFAIDNTFSVWTTWKTTSDPNADGSPWVQF
jgi:hypothetical protein